jgi:predicted nucleic-acid-binding protein
MIAIDTNILVRYITQDDLQQAEATENLLATYNNKPQSIFINNIVLCEFVWVLEKGYKYTQQQISSTIRIILSTEEFAFEYHNVLWLALEEYELKNTDFSDSLISKLNHNLGYKQTFSFDKSAIKNNLFTPCD